MTGDAELPSGWFDQHGWWINARGTTPEGVLLASAHESNHRQLQYSTTFGAVTLTMHSIAQSSDKSRRKVVRSLVKCSEATHEAFATWCSVTALGRTNDVLNGYPLYQRHWHALDRVVQSISSPYVRFHAAHAIARACMQSPVPAIALAIGLDRFDLCDVPERSRPDFRFRLLRRSMLEWRPLLARLREMQAIDRALDELVEATELRADLFDGVHHERWDLVNRVTYEHVAKGLSLVGCETLSHDSQLEWTGPLLAAAERLTGAPLPLEAGGPRDPQRTAHVVLRNIESEGFANGPHLRARLLPSTTQVASMIGAHGADAHVFLSLRLPDAQTASYDVQLTPSAHAVAVLRRTVIDTDEQPTVELLDITGLNSSDLDFIPNVVSLVALSVLDDATSARWARWTTPDRCAILVDRSLGAHLDVWLAGPNTRFRYCLLKLESFGRRLPVLVGQIQVVGTPGSHLMIKPLSDAAVRVHKAALEEFALEGLAVDADPSILEAARQFLPLVLAHLAGEETRFAAVD